MGRSAEAIADYDRALELRPANAEDHCTGRARWPISAGSTRRWRVRRAPSRSCRRWRRPISIAPDVPVADPAAGRCAPRLRSAIKLYPEWPVPIARRGLALKALGRLDEAKASFERAGELDPQFRRTGERKLAARSASASSALAAAGISARR